MALSKRWVHSEPLHLVIFALACFCNAGSLYAQRSTTDDVIRFYQWKISQDPDDFFNYDKLGTAYIRKGRETGDITYYDLAEKALDKSLQLESEDREAVSATLHLASVYFAEHRFREALDYAQKALSFGTGDLSPYAVVGDAFVELGEYDQAAAAYSKLQDNGSSVAPHQGLAYLASTRKASLEFLKGDVQDSIQDMLKAVEAAIASQMPKESVAWTQFTLSEELFQEGDLTHAQAAAQDALTTYPTYHLALAEMAKIRAAQGQLQESVDLYKRAIAVIPMPAYAAGLGDVYTKLGLPAEAKKQYDLVEFIAHLSAMSKAVYNRELAMFYADHGIKLRESLEFAQRELEVRHDIYTWDCLAWVLAKNGRNTEAADAITKALAQGTKDALLYFHAGMIYFALGDGSKAREYLAGAIGINPRFHVLYADVAQRKLSQIEQHNAQ
jgi:tetratricopeptide (TPR) repeat protein